MYFYCYGYIFLLYVYVRLLWLRFFHAFFLSCKANARVKPAKAGHGPAIFLIFVLFYVLFVLCGYLYCLYVYVYCTKPPGGYPIAVKYIISYYTISYHIISMLLDKNLFKREVNIVK
jgi:hypothetical protein